VLAPTKEVSSYGNVRGQPGNRSQLACVAAGQAYADKRSRRFAATTGALRDEGCPFGYREATEQWRPMQNLGRLAHGSNNQQSGLGIVLFNPRNSTAVTCRGGDELPTYGGDARDLSGPGEGVDRGQHEHEQDHKQEFLQRHRPPQAERLGPLGELRAGQHIWRARPR
jgi:hypothetical protein